MEHHDLFNPTATCMCFFDTFKINNEDELKKTLACWLIHK